MAPNRFFAAPIREQRLLKLSQDVIRDMDIAEDSPETTPKLLLPHIRQSALASILSAAVMGVLTLLDLGGHLAIVISARKQAAIGEVVCSVSRLVVAPEYRLNPVELITRHKRCMGPLIEFALPTELARIERVFHLWPETPRELVLAFIRFSPIEGRTKAMRFLKLRTTSGNWWQPAVGNGSD